MINREQYYSEKINEMFTPITPVEISKEEAMELINKIDCEELIEYMEDREITDRSIVVLDSKGNYLSQITVGITDRKVGDHSTLLGKEAGMITDTKTNVAYTVSYRYGTNIETVKEIEVNGVKKNIYIYNSFVENYKEEDFPTEKIRNPSILSESEDAIIYGITDVTSRNGVDGIFINDGPIAVVKKGDQLNENLAIINEEGLEVGAGTPEGYELLVNQTNEELIKNIFKKVVKIIFSIVVVIIVIRWMIKFRRSVLGL